ncbi:DUF3822 family protein [Maribellus maritimus]|uniref:DUF3822 family protein n=1 Tax=Maribellus maritimus TaxID=2870838 RepID=UPI001EEC7925|nr:DUF3822 family protein [Maribellus maritimus]MCG6186417.1 DUF3822 family protein [Maribellus maritimus]
MDIVADELFDKENTQEYLLSIQISLGGFSFIVASAKENRLLAWKNTPLTITSVQFLQKRFQEWLDMEEILKQQYQKVHLIFDTKEFVPVPEKYYEEQESKKLVESVFELSSSEFEIAENQVNVHDLRLLFTLPKGLKGYLSEQFPDLEIFHPLTICIENLPEISADRNGLIILFSSGYFYLVLFREQKLLLANSYNLSHKNDIIFYTLSTTKQYHFNPTKTDVFIAGDIYGGEETILEIKEYFTSTQLLKPAKDIEINTEIFNTQEYSLYNLQNSVL